MVWEWCRNSLGMVQEWSGNGAGMVWEWCRDALGMVQEWSGARL